MDYAAKYAVDVLLAIVFLAAVLISAKRGFIKSIFNTLSCLAAAFIAAKANGYASSWLFNAIIRQRLINLVTSRLPENLNVNDAALYVKSLVNNIPGILAKTAKVIGVDLNFVSGKFVELKLTNDNIVNQLVDVVAKPVVISVLNLIFFFVIFILLVIVFEIISSKVSKNVKESSLVVGDKLLGGVLGAVKGLLFVVILAVLLVFIADLDPDSKFYQIVNNSIIISKFSTNEIIVRIFSV